MVDKSGETPRRGADWPAIHAARRAGAAIETLAERFELQPATVRVRLAWIDSVFPPGAPERLIHSFSRQLAEAETDLAAGRTAEAERRAKAVAALVRAAQSVKEMQTSMDAEKAAAEAAAGEDERELKALRAELERRLDRLAEQLRAEEADGEPERGPDAESAD